MSSGGLSIAELLQIISDEQKYIDYVAENERTGNDSNTSPIFTIPRQSFTAFRLSFASPSEIERSSKVRFLGGIPQCWYQEQKSKRLKVLSKLTLGQLRKRTELLTSHNYRNIYQKKDNERSDCLLFENSSINVFDYNQFQDKAMRKYSHVHTKKPKITLSNNIREYEVHDNNNIKFPIFEAKTATKPENRSKGFDTFIPHNNESSNIFFQHKNIPKPLYGEHKFRRLDNPKNTIDLLHEVQKLDYKRENTISNAIQKINILKLMENYPTPVTNSQLTKANILENQSHQLYDTFLSQDTIHDKSVIALNFCQPEPVSGIDMLLVSARAQLLRLERGRDEYGLVNITNTQKKKDISLPPPSNNMFPNFVQMGNILLVDKMLVMLKVALKQRYPIQGFSEIECIDTRIEERWKEYYVVAREALNDSGSVFLQFFKNREAFKQSTILTSSYSKNKHNDKPLDFFLDYSCMVDLFSNLDKSIAIQRPSESDILQGGNHITSSNIGNSPLKIYILQCFTTNTSYKWLNFLKDSIRKLRIESHLLIRVPEARITVNVPLHHSILKIVKCQEEKEKDYLMLCRLYRGYNVLQPIFARYLTMIIFEELKNASMRNRVSSWKMSDSLFGCDLRRFDRIEWVTSQLHNVLGASFALRNSHVLEYRKFEHQSGDLNLPGGELLCEPVPIEGYLFRYSNKYGKDIHIFGRMRTKLSYIFTCDNLLFTLRSFKSIPPFPIGIATNEIGFPHDLEDARKLHGIFPYVYEQNPYKLTSENHIKWMNENTSLQEFHNRDHYAFNCLNRRINQILNAESVLDLTRVVDIMKVEDEEINVQDLKYEEVFKDCSSIWQDTIESKDIKSCMIRITTDENIILKLLAPSPLIAEEWISSLQILVKYWKLRQKMESSKLQRLQHINMKKIHASNLEEINLSGEIPKWISDGSFASPEFYNIDGLALLRPIINRGILFQKSKKHSVFVKSYVILVPGFLIFFHCFNTSVSGFVKLTVDYAHHVTLPIDNFYLYSGSVAELDLLERETSYDILNPGSHMLPRLYEDGWQSKDNEVSRCFTLRPVRKSSSSTPIQVQEFGTGSKFHKKHNNYGKDISSNFSQTLREADDSNKKQYQREKSIMFLARSRQERDLWVLSLRNEIDRLLAEI